MATAKQNAATALTLDERIALETAPGWRPTANEETLIEKATVVGLRMHHHDEFGDTPVVVYRKTDGKFIAVYAFHAVLRDRLRELGTTLGSVQTLKYLGAQTSNTRVDANGNPQRYESYYVENDGAEVTAVAENFAF